MKTSIFILLIVLNLPFNNEIFCQSKIDSLKNKIEISADNRDKITHLLELVEEMLKSNNGETLKYLTQAEKLSSKLNDKDQLARMYYDFGKYYNYLGDYKKAIEYSLKSVKSAKKNGQEKILEKALNNLAIVNMRTKNYERGIEIFKQLLAIEKKKKNEDGIIYYLINLATAYGEKGNMVKAEEYLLNAYSSRTHNSFYKAVAANDLAFIYNKTNKYSKAKKFSNDALELSKSVQDIGFKIEALTNLSNALRGMSKYKRSEKIIKQIIRLAKENNFKRKMNNAVGNLALNYEATRDYKNALKYYKEFSQRSDSLLNESTENKINELQIKYETEKKDNEIAKTNAALKEKNLILTYTLVGGLFAIVVSVIIFVLYKKIKSAYTELVRKNLELLKSENVILPSKDKRTSKSTRYQSSSLSEEKKDELRKKIENKIREEKIFLQSDLTLEKFAAQLEINSKYLSQVLHEIYNSSFADFINNLRVKEAAKLLSDASYQHISIEGISELVGYHTKSSFNSAFKKFMGVTPSFFSHTSTSLSKKVNIES